MAAPSEQPSSKQADEEARNGLRAAARGAGRFESYAAQCAVFLRGFLEHPRMVGSIIPSSRFTVRKMLEPVDWQRCELFVEYGPGIGTFCRPVLERLRSDGTMIVIDTNPLYIDYLRRAICDARFHAVLGSAEDVEAIVAERGFAHADYVLSGLPFSTLPEGAGEAIVDATYRVLRGGGAFMAYQFTDAVAKVMATRFSRIEEGREWLNILPCKLFWAWKEDGAAGSRAA